MPTRISAGVGDLFPNFSFITMIPIDCKITNGFSTNKYLGAQRNNYGNLLKSKQTSIRKNE